MLGFNIRTKEAIPENTIKKVWDAYEDSNFRGHNLGALYGTNTLDGVKRAARLEKKDRYPKLPNKGEYYDGRYSSGKVPIGAWGDSLNSKGGALHSIYYGGAQHNDSSFPQRMTDNIATNCAGGSKMIFDEYPTTSIPIRNSNNSQTTSKNCILESPSVSGNDGERYFIGGVHYPSYCQMGDYISTQDKCKTQCKGLTSTSPVGYCTWAKDRLCGKKKGDPIKKNDFNTVIKSDRDWITDNECKNYCGGPGEEGSALCQQHKRDYCTNPDNWPEAAEYCYNYWSKNNNKDEIELVCGDKLVDGLNKTNILTGEGCGYLCRGEPLDINSNYCNSKRLEYCTKDPSNMEGEECYQFCRLNSELCESYLDRYCADKGDKLDENIPGTKRKYSDYCGCLMGTEFYEKYVDEIFKQFDEGGYNIEGASNIKTAPECIFPKCKGGSIMTASQKEHSKQCGSNCIQVMLNNFTDSSLVGDFMAQQSADCTNIEKKEVKETIIEDKPDEEEPETINDIQKKQVQDDVVVSVASYPEYVKEVVNNPKNPTNALLIFFASLLGFIIFIIFASNVYTSIKKFYKWIGFTEDSKPKK